ncbi:hypothetical protein KAJ87_01625 [Candidatus Pacearchaeota archaeon]|nr:hypothetical protein [Candidatus Pacearchaeota archaeon]
MNERKPKRTSLEIKKEILKLLKSKERTFRDLETKVNTNFETIKTQIKELEYLGFVKTIKHERSEHTGRPFTTVKLIQNI